jgi:hypothetical protein
MNVVILFTPKLWHIIVSIIIIIIIIINFYGFMYMYCPFSPQMA